MQTDVLIAGAGISGLSVAYALKQAGLRVTLVEASARVGGNIASERTATGFVLDQGPNTVASNAPALWTHFDELGIGEALEVADHAGARRYLLHHGALVALPSSPTAALSTPLLTPLDKLRLLAEPLLPAAPIDESIDAFFTRRLGPAPARTLVDAFVSGVYGGDSAALSMRAAFPSVWEGEQAHGSIVRGMLARRRSARRSSTTPKQKTRRNTFSFRNGLATWPRALATALGDAVQLETRLESLERTNNGWQATVLHDGEATTMQAAHVVLALPAYAAAEILRTGPAHDALAAIPYAPMALIHLGYCRADVAHPLDGFGLLCPSGEGRAVLGSLWPSTLFPGRAPADCVLTANFIGGARFPERVALDEEVLIELAHNELQRLLGVRGEPVVARVTRWPRGIPQYVAGHTARMAVLEHAEADQPGLHFLSNYRDGVGVEACWQNAQRLATHIVEQAHYERVA